MHRINRYNYIIKASITSKNTLFSVPKLELSAKINAGLYKPAAVKFEHSLMLTSITAKTPISKYQLHGKRKKRTISLNTQLTKNGSFIAIDKIVHELFPKIPDFYTPKVRRPAGNNYLLRLKQKFTPLPDFEDLISSSMYDEYRGVFLPINIHLVFTKTAGDRTHITAHYLRMLRLPFNFYNKRLPPAFDDAVTFNQVF